MKSVSDHFYLRGFDLSCKQGKQDQLSDAGWPNVAKFCHLGYFLRLGWKQWSIFPVWQNFGLLWAKFRPKHLVTMRHGIFPDMTRIFGYCQFEMQHCWWHQHCCCCCFFMKHCGATKGLSDLISTFIFMLLFYKQFFLFLRHQENMILPRQVKACVSN